MGNTATSYKELFDSLNRAKAISDIWIKVLNMLDTEFEYSDNSLQVLCLYFSFLDDGNICIPLNVDMLMRKWNTKWNKHIQEFEESDEFLVPNQSNIDIGISDLEEYSKTAKLNVLFFIDQYEDTDWIFAKKYYDSKLIIEDKIKCLFSNKCQRRILNPSNLSYHSKYTPDDYQIEAIKLGMRNNLIITGGPGTGKTTVVYDILKNILLDLQNEFNEWSFYLTAPTGKAADRLGESILDCLEKDQGFNSATVRNQLAELAKSRTGTIHRLLKYSPKENKFKINDKESFPTKSVIVIDEASMIDICLFASLLKAIPDDAIVFLLGDDDQLPSVDAGAVLGSILGQKKGDSYTVKLNISHRAEEEGKDIWTAAQIINGIYMNNELLSDKAADAFLKLIDNLKCIELVNSNENTTSIEEMISTNVIKYFNSEQEIASLYSCESKANADAVFKLTKNFKILCAEKRGPHGVETINQIIIKQINENGFDPNEYFPGELLMITKNNPILNLFNGDDGVVVKFKDDDSGTLWFMIKKGIEGENEADEITRNGIFAKDGYTYYPLYLIPRDSIEVSYAITIHKSQGSGYDEILIFMPHDEHHSLVNRQILYTAITRAKRHVTLYSSEDVIKAAINNKEIRDTMIALNN